MTVMENMYVNHFEHSKVLYIFHVREYEMLEINEIDALFVICPDCNLPYSNCQLLFIYTTFKHKVLKVVHIGRGGL